MKRRLLISACSLLFSTLCFSQNQWRWLNPQPSGWSCLKVVFTDHQTGFILNSNGDLIKTTNQGNSWNAVANFPDAGAFDIRFSTGVVAGNAGRIYLSADNGYTWDSVHTDFTDVAQFVNIVSSDSFFISTSAGIIHATGDRGRTWKLMNCNNQINCISFLNSSIAYAGSKTAGVLKTTDGGQTWQSSAQVNYFPSSILAIQFLNADTGYAFREYDSLLITHDGGNTWQSYNGYQSMYAIDFVNPTLGFLGGDDGALYRSVDGGVTWNSVSPTNGFIDNYDINSIQFVSADTGFAVGNLGRILKTTDSGQTWQSYSPTYTPVYSVAFGSASTGFATSRNNVLKTTDTGRSWTKLGLTTGTDFGSNSVFKYAHFTSADTGYVVSNNYVSVHKTNDGGETWTTINPNVYSYDDLAGVSYPDPGTGILSSGTILSQTTNGGDSWTPLWTAQFSNQYIGNIFFINATLAYSINNSQLYKTTDAFQNWTVNFTNPTGYSLTSVWFINTQKGFVTDEESQIFVTNDGGATWQQVSFADSFIYDTFNSTIKFFNDQVGYLVTGNIFGPGSFGRIYKTTDGGQTWQLSYKTGGSSISFSPDSAVIVAGYGGTILRAAIKGWQVDTLTATTDNSCGELLSASIGVALGEVDSIRFEITGPGGLVNLVNTDPGFVVNGRISFSSRISNLASDSMYRVRLKFFYNGEYSYSDPVSFIAQSLPKPFIGDSSGVLLSSANTGNQWFLNGAAILGETQRSYTPTHSGSYTVQTTQGSCVSPMSAPVNFVVNDLGVIVSPNPTTGYLYLQNTQNRFLSVAILDLMGRTLISGTYTYSGTAIDVRRLSLGEYIVQVRDKTNGQVANILFVKL